MRTQLAYGGLAATELAAAIADGLGGLAGGDFAARLALDTFGERVCSNPHIELKDVASEIHHLIRGKQAEDGAASSMATTFSAVVLRKGQLSGIHCGDTRIALARGPGIKRLTTDQTEAQRLLDAGKLTREEFAVYARKNVLWSALGIRGTPTFQTVSHALQDGDRVFLTSDGVHGKILLREFQAFSQRAVTPEALVDLLTTEMAKRKPDDNYSSIVVFAMQDLDVVAHQA